MQLILSKRGCEGANSLLKTQGKQDKKRRRRSDFSLRLSLFPSSHLQVLPPDPFLILLSISSSSRFIVEPFGFPFCAKGDQKWSFESETRVHFAADWTEQMKNETKCSSATLSPVSPAFLSFMFLLLQHYNNTIGRVYSDRNNERRSGSQSMCSCIRFDCKISSWGELALEISHSWCHRFDHRVVGRNNWEGEEGKCHKRSLLSREEMLSPKSQIQMLVSE